MEETYSDRYVFPPEDPRMEAYFKSLPGYVQAQILGRKYRPATYQELVDAADEARKIF